MARTGGSWRTFVVAVATLLGLGVLGTAAAATDPGSLTVTFHTAEDGACGTVPSVGGLTVPADTPVQFLNRTGSDATLVVGGQDEPVPKGAGVELTIAVGQYEVRLVKACGTVAVSQPVAVTVVAVAPSPTPAPTTSAPAATVPAGSAPPTAGQEGAVGVPTGHPTTAATRAVASPAPMVGASIDPAATPAPTPGTSRPAAGNDWSPVLAATPVGLDETGRNSKEVRLLAVVATICVLGVTAAIIRSIVRLSP